MPTATGIVWDLAGYFPSFNGPEMVAFKREIVERLEEGLSMARPLAPLNAENQEAWERVVLHMEDLQSRFSHLSSYLGCLSASDAKNEDYTAEQGALAVLGSKYEELGAEFQRALKETSDPDFEAFVHKQELAGAAHFLKRSRESARRSMPPEMEVLSSKLEVDGMKAWGRPYNTISGRLEFLMKWPDGREETVPMAKRRSLLEDADRRVRQAAFQGGNKAWREMEPVAAAAINHIAGTRLTLNRERGITDFLEPALFQMGIQRETLNAMYSALDSRVEGIRGLAHRKARLLGQSRLAWYDLGAAIPAGDAPLIPWADAARLVGDAFNSGYPRLNDYFQRMLNERWIEAESRPGKRPGAFCTGSHLTRESRVYMTYGGTLGDVRTLAHEVGHAWHHQVMRDLRSLARRYPMTLAESASTFAERLLTDGLRGSSMLSESRRRESEALEVSEGIVYLLDITARFRFEKAFHEERLSGEVKASRLSELMAAAQHDVMGDLLEEDGADPLYWASKLHFYITGVTFYNFPYTFGYLLSHALHTIYRREGASFLPRYEDFLRATGSMSPEQAVGESIGADISKPAFWEEAIDGLLGGNSTNNGVSRQ